MAEKGEEPEAKRRKLSVSSHGTSASTSRMEPSARTSHNVNQQSLSGYWIYFLAFSVFHQYFIHVRYTSWCTCIEAELSMSVL